VRKGNFAARAAMVCGVSSLSELEAEIGQLRDALFALGDVARRKMPPELTTLRVSLQSASNQLGEAERALRLARSDTPTS
jgi:hypothetical protein